MANIEEIVEKIERLYERTQHATVDVPLVLQARELAHFAKHYISAASVLERESPEHWLPILQLTGQAVELSLKACLASAGNRSAIWARPRRTLSGSREAWLRARRAVARRNR